MHLVERINDLSLDDIERIEKLTLRWIFQAVYDFGAEAHEVFRCSVDDVKDVAEDVTRELLDRLPGYNVPRRVFGTVDYKKYRYIVLPEQMVRQALFVDSKAEKTARNATLQMSQTSMHIHQRRGDDIVSQAGLLPVIYKDVDKELLTTTAFVHFHYEGNPTGYRLLSTSLLCIPNGLLQERYNPNENISFWLAGRNAPTRGEDFRVRVGFQKLSAMAHWRLQELHYDADGRCAGEWIE
ncbi:MAG: SfiI family type II restriction endonuclease [Burkholderiaceae bacterium]|jgi:hypothetical protein|nr:SfiI family type II restriction endonuclease [Burkholderiaceae bacterium]